MQHLLALLFAFAIPSAYASDTYNKAGIYARQLSSPGGLPGGDAGWGVCQTQCKPWGDYLSICSSAADVLGCYCSQGYMDKMVTCYNCLVPLAQQSSDARVSNFPEQAQSAIDDVARSCTEGEHPISAPKLNASPSSGSPPTGSSSSSGTADHSTASGPEATNSAKGNGASPTSIQAPTNGDRPSSNGAASSASMLSYAIAISGVIGTVVGSLA